MEADRERSAAGAEEGERLEAARAYVGTLERILYKNRHVLTDSHTSALALGAGRFRDAFYPVPGKGSSVTTEDTAAGRHGDRGAGGRDGVQTLEAGSQTAVTTPPATTEASSGAERSSGERALRASLRLAEAARAALASDLEQARRRCEELGAAESAKQQLQERLADSEAHCADLEGRVARLEAEAASARDAAARLQRAIDAGCLTGGQLESCRAISGAAAALEELLPRAVAMLEAAGDAADAKGSLEECGPLLAGLTEALGQVAEGLG